MMLQILPTDKIQDEIVQDFSSLKDWEARYRHIIELGKGLPTLPDDLKTPDSLVKGCQSQVWMHAQMQPDRTIHYQADSDALIVRGLIALILKIYSDQTPETILATKPDFFERIGMGQHISMQRSNGLYAMIKQIQFYALAFQLKAASS